MKALAFILIGLVVIVSVAVTPILFIWSLNTLFNLGITYGVKTWLASFFLVLVITAKSPRVRKKLHRKEEHNGQ